MAGVLSLFDLAGRKAVVTGAGQGLGKGMAVALAQAGADVAVVDLRTETAEQTALELRGLGRQAFALQCDVAKPDQVEAMAERVLGRFGQVDILVNNAGIAGLAAPLVDYPLAEWERILKTDLTGPFLCCRALAPHMVRRGYGRIVNIASVAGKEGNPNAAAYSAAKAGLIALTKSLGKELAKTGVLVNCVTPAAARTAILDQLSPQHVDYMLSKIPMGRFVLVDEIAAMAAWLASPDCSFTTGGVFDISGGRATY